MYNNSQEFSGCNQFNQNQSSSSFGRITQNAGSAVATFVGTTAGALGAARQIQAALKQQF